MALLDPLPRAATITADSDMHLLVLGTRNFSAMLLDFPVVSRTCCAEWQNAYEKRGGSDAVPVALPLCKRVRRTGTRGETRVISSVELSTVSDEDPSL
jgi:hypothetical protein